MDTGTEATTAPVMGVGVELTGGWRVVRVLGSVDGHEVVIAEDDAFGRAFCTIIGDGGLEPALDEASASGWGTVRRILRDPVFGRVVLDEVPEGALLADRIEEGWAAPEAWFAELSAHVREQHRQSRVHGHIDPERVVIGADGVSLPVWGLATGDPEDLRARDLAALSAISSAAPRPSAAVPPPLPDEAHVGTDAAEPAADELFDPGPEAGATGVGLDVSPLRRAIAADHLPALRSAIEQWSEQGGDQSLPEFRRAADALARLESKVTAQLGEAERMLSRGDPLGAVSLCREAVRLGAEEEAEPILRQARRQARSMVSPGGRRLSWRAVALAGAAAGALGLLLLAGWVSLRPSPSERRIDETITRLERDGGPRATVRWLLEEIGQGAADSYATAMLAEKMQDLVNSERDVLLALRSEVVARGARPRRADELAESSLRELEHLAEPASLESPLLASSVARTLVLLDKAAALYRAGTEIRPEDALMAVEQLLVEDPVFAASEPTGDQP